MLLPQNACRPLGYQQLTIDATTSTALTVPAGTAYCIGSCTAQALRWRDDGTNPTASVGFPEAVAQEFVINNPAAIKLIGQVASTVLNVCYYGGPG